MNWTSHHGLGKPVENGTLVDVLHFNGDVTTGMAAGSGMTFAPDGTVVSPDRARWSGWNHHDGGPMGPKFRAWRPHITAEQRNTALFRSWLIQKETA